MHELNLVEYGMGDVYIFLIVEAAVLMILAIYFETVLPIGPGVKSHPCFCLPKKIRCGEGEEEEMDDEEEAPMALPDDVAAERERILKGGKSKLDGKSKDEITVHDLRKVYPVRIFLTLPMFGCSNGSF